MSIIDRMRKQTAVLWRTKGVDHQGMPTYHPPQLVSCRWDSDQAEFLSPDGIKEVSNAVVYLPFIVPSQSVLLEASSLANLKANPLDNEGAFPVRQQKKIPNLKATKTLFIAYL